MTSSLDPQVGMPAANTELVRRAAPRWLCIPHDYGAAQINKSSDSPPRR